MAKPQHWLIKSEPSVYPYSQLEADEETEWSGVRNFEARNNLRAMKPGDLCLYYHSGEGKEIVGVAKVVGGPQTDSTAKGEDWASVMVAPLRSFFRPIGLAEIKKDRALKTFPLVTRSRLSVAKVEPEHFAHVLSLAKTKMSH